MLAFIGGTKAIKRNIEVFDYVALRWEEVKVSGELPARSAFSLVGNEETLFMFGGTDGLKDFNDTFLITAKKVNVGKKVRIEFNVMRRVMGGHVPRVRSYHSTSLANNRMFIFGGKSGTNFLNDFFFLDLQTLVWFKLEIDGVPPSPRCAHASVIALNKLYIYGGFDGKKPLDDFFCVHNVHDKLVTVPDMQLSCSKAFRDELFCDLLLRVETGEKVGVHKILVLSRCPALESCVEKEEEGIDVAFVGQISKPALISFIEYLYTDNLVSSSNQFQFSLSDNSEESNEIWKELSELSKLFMLERLSHICECNFNAEMVVPSSEEKFEYLEKFVNNEKFSDLSIITNDNKKILAHRIVLASRSEYFRMMLTSSMKESKQIQVKLPFEFEDLLQVMSFIYTDKLPKLSEDPNEAIKLLEVSNLLILEKLKLICEAKLLGFVEVDCAAYLLHLSDIYECKTLRGKCVGYIRRMFSEVSKDVYFNESLPSRLQEECRKTI